MKKHDEGYILAYVFIILVVICLIAVSVLTIPLNNLRIQQAQIDGMIVHYNTQGMIEKTLGAMKSDLDKIDDFATLASADLAKERVLKCSIAGQDMGILNMVTNADKEPCAVEDITGDGIYITSAISWTSGSLANSHSCSFDLTAVSGGEMISTRVQLQNLVIGNEILMPGIVCSSYTVSEFIPPVTQPQEGGSQDAA